MRQNDLKESVIPVVSDTDKSPFESLLGPEEDSIHQFTDQFIAYNHSCLPHTPLEILGKKSKELCPQSQTVHPVHLSSLLVW